MSYPLCIDCKFFQPAMQPSQCRANQNERPDFVVGGITYDYRSAQVIRLDPKLCGAKGAWFVAKVEQVAA